MSKYIESDRKEIKRVFEDIYNTLNKATGPDIKGPDIITIVAECVKKVEYLGYDLQHLDTEGTESDKINLDKYNVTGDMIVKANISAILQDLKDSMEDMSWVEGIEDFSKSQIKTKEELISIINSNTHSDAEKENAQAGLNVLAPTIPDEDTPDWVVRKMRNTCVLMGLINNLHNLLISAATI